MKNREMSGKKWFISIIVLLLCIMGLLSGTVFCVDPFFHYRAPNKNFFYTLFDQRSQNDGITRKFDYDAIITGTSMAENFKSSQFDYRFVTKSIKVTYSGATYKEINDNLKVSYKSGHSPEYILRPLDYSLMLRDKDELRTDMGEYPDWLTNSNPFDDVKYLLNRDVIINYCLPALLSYFNGPEPGYTSFDEYSYTGDTSSYGKEYVLQGKEEFTAAESFEEVTEEDYEMLCGNFEQNVVNLAKEHPETTFLYFFPPYSMAFWGTQLEEGSIYKTLELKKKAIEMMLECDNIHIYSFSLDTEITGNLDLYRDVAHYDPSVNEMIIEKIADSELISKDNEIRITYDNYEQYLEKEKSLLLGFDYNILLQ